jgi:hypothetical protein
MKDYLHKTNGNYERTSSPFLKFTIAKPSLNYTKRQYSLPFAFHYYAYWQAIQSLLKKSKATGQASQILFPE